MKQLLQRLVNALGGDTLMVRGINHRLVPMLREYAAQLPAGAQVLDVGAKHALYRQIFSRAQFRTMDLVPTYQPDLVCDLLELSRAVPANSVDAIICTEVLEHVREPEKALAEIHTVLKPGGLLFATTPFLVPYHPDPQDYWRFTVEGWRKMLASFSEAKVFTHGNQLRAVCYLAGHGWGYPLRVLNPLIARLGAGEDRYFPLGYLVQARK